MSCSARPSACGDSGSTSQPVRPGSTRSRSPGMRVTITGVPAAKLSSTTSGNASQSRDGSTVAIAFCRSQVLAGPVTCPRKRTPIAERKRGTALLQRRALLAVAGQQHAGPLGFA